MLLGFLAGLGDRGGPRRHHVGDAVIEAVLAAHDEVRAGEALRPHRVLDQGRAAASPEPVANGVLERWFTPAWAQAHEETVASYRRMLCATPADGYAGCCEAIAELDLRSELPEIAAPTLVIAGADDRATPPEHAEAITAAIPTARLEVLGEAAHLASVQRADAVTRLVDEHLTDR